MTRGIIFLILSFFSVLLADNLPKNERSWAFSGDATNLSFRYKLNLISKIKGQQLFWGYDLKKYGSQNKAHLIVGYVKAFENKETLSLKILGKSFSVIDTLEGIFLPIFNFKGSLEHIYAQYNKKGMVFTVHLPILKARVISNLRFSISREFKF